MLTKLLKTKNCGPASQNRLSHSGWLKIGFFVLLFAISYSLSALPAHSARIGISKPGNNLGLIGWWTFDGADMNPNVRDKSGNGRHGNLTNFTSTTTAPGKIGQALSFRQNTSQYVSVVPQTFIEGLGAMTVSAWIKPKTSRVVSSGEDILLNYNNSNQQTIYFYRNPLEGISFSVRTSAFAEANSANNVITDTNWHQVVGVYDGAQIYIYVDGVQSGTPVAQTGVTMDTFGDLKMSSSDAATDKLELIDDVRVYNRALGASEIKAQYNSGSIKFTTPNNTKTSLENGLVGHWTFDGKDMPLGKVLDTSGNGRHGSSSGMATSTAYVQGRLGQALNFDGNDDIITTSSDFIGTSDTTVTAWIKLKSYGGTNLGQIITNESFMFRVRGGGSNQLDYRANNNTASATDVNSILLNQWYFVTMTRTGTTANFYINGAQSGTPNQTNEAPVSGSSVKIGNRSGNDQGFDGQIDDLRVYNRILSATEIKQLYNLGGEKIGGTVNSGKPSLSTGLIGHWTFDGKDMPLGRVLDVSGNGKHASAFGMSTSTMYVQGKFGQALNFDAVNDSVDTALDFFGLSAFTVSQWVYAKNPGQYHTFWSADGSAGGCLNGDGVYFSGPTTLNFRAANVGDEPITVPNIKNKWTHVVSTYDATNRRVYFDNVLVYNQAGGSATTGDVDFQIGAYNNCISSPDENFGGIIDDTRVYNRVLSTTEIQQLYNMGK